MIDLQSIISHLNLVAWIVSHFINHFSIKRNCFLFFYYGGVPISLNLRTLFLIYMFHIIDVSSIKEVNWKRYFLKLICMFIVFNYTYTTCLVLRLGCLHFLPIFILDWIQALCIIWLFHNRAHITFFKLRMLFINRLSKRQILPKVSRSRSLSISV